MNFLSRLFNRTPAVQRTHAVPPGERVYAIGDVHGRHDLLTDLLARIDADDAARGTARTTVIFLGDLVDRGPESAAVIDTAMALAGQDRYRVRFIMGNHEEMFLAAARGDVRVLRQFVKYGGQETIISYGMSDAEYARLDFDELADRVLALIPRSHVDFVADFEPWIAIGDYLFVHAGIRPGAAIADQRDSDLRWIRDEFLNARTDHGAMVVHGHTISESVDEQSNRIGIDTGAYHLGRLTAIGLEGGDRWYVEAVGDARPQAHRADWKG